MIIETILRHHARLQARRLLAFPKTLSGEAPELPPPRAGTEYLLYLHIPFCEELCPYCSFHRLRLDEELAGRYFHALREEMRHYRDLGYCFSGAYVGGGTPTVMPKELEAILALARELWPIRSLSVETNPNHLTGDMLDLLKDCGVDRLSVGVQSFDDGLLASIHRYHRYGSGSEIRSRLAAARGRFRTINVDLIYNFRGQSEALLRRDLRVLRELATDQITFYPLMGSRARRGPYRRQKRFYNLIRAELAGAYLPSTAWCFSRLGSLGAKDPAPIDEYIVACEQYAGLGSGSFGYLGGRLYANSFSVARYVELLGRGLPPVAAVRSYAPADRVRYDFLIQLFGGHLDLAALEVRHGPEAMRALDPALALLRLTGVVRRRGRIVSLTPRGYYVWVILMREFFQGVNRLRQDCLALATEAQDAGHL
jgi:coproporphyrinogen III oxidase-like Fe-S oxidoreductase